MNKTKLLMIGLVFMMIVGGVALKKLVSEGQVKIGNPDNNFAIVGNGSYTLEDLDMEAGEYAIYAVEGSGTVSIIASEYKVELNDKLFQDAKTRGSGAMNAIIYEESPKINFDKRMTLRVAGDENFKISFLRR